MRQSETRTKELEEERNRLQKTSTAQLSQLDKYRKLSDDRQSLVDSLETQVGALKKVGHSVLCTDKLITYITEHKSLTQ